ncbi:hypothetical protein ACVINW_006008 [Bradyrhizobium sp. USDA 4461]
MPSACATRSAFRATVIPGLSNCSYPSYQACLATANGIGQTCVANPYYAGDNDPRSYLHTPARERGDSFFDLFIH